MVHFKEYLNNLKRVMRDLDQKEDILEENINIHENIDKMLKNEIRSLENGSSVVRSRIHNLEAADKCIEALYSIDAFTTEYMEKIKNYDERNLENGNWEDDLRGLLKKYNEINSLVDEYMKMTSTLSETRD